MSFKNEDKSQATMITQDIKANLVNVTGQVSDQAAVTNIQNSRYHPVDIKAVVDFSKQARKEITTLPDTSQDDAQNCIGQILEEASKEDPDHFRIRSLLTSLRDICKDAAGSPRDSGYDRKPAVKQHKNRLDHLCDNFFYRSER